MRPRPSAAERTALSCGFFAREATARRKIGKEKEGEGYESCLYLVPLSFSLAGRPVRYEEKGGKKKREEKEHVRVVAAGFRLSIPLYRLLPGGPRGKKRREEKKKGRKGKKEKREWSQKLNPSSRILSFIVRGPSPAVEERGKERGKEKGRGGKTPLPSSPGSPILPLPVSISPESFATRLKKAKRGGGEDKKEGERRKEAALLAVFLHRASSLMELETHHRKEGKGKEKEEKEGMTPLQTAGRRAIPFSTSLIYFRDSVANHQNKEKRKKKEKRRREAAKHFWVFFFFFFFLGGGGGGREGKEGQRAAASASEVFLFLFDAGLVVLSEVSVILTEEREREEKRGKGRREGYGKD